MSESVPALIKLDVEGFEWQVLQGAENTLRNLNLKAIIIELNESGGRYGIADETIHEFIVSFGFMPCRYDPFKRSITQLQTFNPNGNTIYLRDIPFVKDRVQNQRKIRVLGIEF